MSFLVIYSMIQMAEQQEVVVMVTDISTLLDPSWCFLVPWFWTAKWTSICQHSSAVLFLEFSLGRWWGGEFWWPCYNKLQFSYQCGWGKLLKGKTEVDCWYWMFFFIRWFTWYEEWQGGFVEWKEIIFRNCSCILVLHVQ